jgi:predicted RNase H-like HicB family nuclease
MTTKNEETSEKTVGILSKAYARRLVPDETGGYVASIQEFPGCVAEGDTPDAAIQNLDKAAASWVQVALSNGYEIRDPVSFHGYSGKIALRIPRGLHKQVAELAELEESSINQLLVSAIAQYLGSKRAFKEMSETMLSDMRKVMSDGVVSLYRNGPATLLIAFSTTDKSYYSGGTTIEGQFVTEKLFNLGGTPAITGKHQLGAMQS